MGRAHLAGLLAAVLLAQCLLGQDAAPAPGADGTPAAPATAPSLAKKPFVITVHGTIDAGLLYAVKRRCAAAMEQGADLIVFDVDTYGGLLDEALQMADYVASLPRDIVTVAYISRKALSAGALFCSACDHIVMRRNTTIGDCAPIVASKEGGVEVLGEKIQSPLRTAFRTYAEDNHTPPVLMQAMVTMEWEVIRISRIAAPDDWSDQQFVRRVDLDNMKMADRDAIKKQEIVCRAGELLTVNDRLATEYGIARFEVEARSDRAQEIAEVLKHYAVPGARPVTLHTSWSEEMVRWLTNPVVSSLILLVGFMALYVGMKTPGTGLAEGLAAACFIVFFAAKFALGLADVLDVALVAAGVALIALEIFVIPGFGIVGVSGIALLVAGFVLMGQSFVIPRVPGEEDFLAKNLISVLAAVLLALVGFFTMLRYAASLPGLRRLVLVSAQGARDGAAPEHVGLRDLTGEEGVVVTPLRPAGRAEFGGDLVDVVAEGEYIEAGEKVTVAAMHGSRVVVRRAT